MSDWIHAGSLEALKQERAKVVKGGIAVFYHEDRVYAVDNRCPHLGFPLHMGTLCDGILTCHWHHARFDVCGGGTLDPWADDVTAYETKIEDGDVWVSAAPKHAGDVQKHFRRLREGLEQNISLVIAKSVIALMEAGVPEADIARIGIDFGTKQRAAGWGSGLTILTAMMNVLPKLDKYGRYLALFHGLAHVARDSSGRGTRYMLAPLPNPDMTIERLSAWYRQCVEVRDTQGAERILLTAAKNGASREQLANMMMIAVTDHFYLDGGHTLDFHNKAFEALRHVGDEYKEQVLTSLIPQLGNATRSEELNSWQTPVNLVNPLHEAFRELAQTDIRHNRAAELDEESFVHQLLSDEPLLTIQTMTGLLKSGVSPSKLAHCIALAAAERIARFHTQNDFGDWITVLHTFTHAHAVHESLRRADEPLAVRALYHAAAAIYLDRFLNIPAASRPKADEQTAKRYVTDPKQLLELMNSQQQVTAAATWVANYLRQGGDAGVLFNTLGHALLREDAEFHTYQMFEAAAAEYDHWSQTDSPFAERAKETLLFALTRYLAAHAPTARELPNTARIAWRLQRGEKLFEETAAAD